MEFYGRIGLHRVLLCCLRGRKDGIPGGDGSTMQSDGKATTIPIYGPSGNTLTDGSTGVRNVSITMGGVLNGNTSLKYAIKNPLAFLYNGIQGDWYTNNQNYQNNALWGDGSMKSAYDPCPKGWRVPTDGIWNDFTSTPLFPTVNSKINVANGRTYKRMAWFPMTGYRNYTYIDALYGMGVYGLYWSSTVSGTGALHLNFVATGTSPNTRLQRGDAHSVRCVQE